MRGLLVLLILASLPAAAAPLAAEAASGRPDSPTAATSDVVATGRLVRGHDRDSFRLRPDSGAAAYVLSIPSTLPDLQLDDLVGQRVRVVGTMRHDDGSRVLQASSIIQAHDHTRAPHQGVVGMAGDRHIELVVTANAAIRIYVLDAFMIPVDVGAITGTAVIQAGDRTRRSAPLRADDSGRFLVVAGDQRHPGDDDITVTVDIDGESVYMTLPFRPEKGPAKDCPHQH